MGLVTDTSTAAGLMRAVTRRHAAALAAIDRRRSLTYDELHDGAARMANGLLEAGVQSGDRVALHVEDTVEALQAYLACWLAGCVAVHVSARLAPIEVAHVLSDADVRAYCYSTGLESVAEQVAGARDLECVRRIDGPARGPADRLGSDTSRDPLAPVQPADIAIIGYTSGTSGRPKGAMVSHRALALSIRLAPSHYRIPLASRLAYSGSISFVGSFWGQVWPHLYVGGTVRFVATSDVDEWLDIMRRDRSTFTFVPTPAMPDLLQELRVHDDVRKNLTTVMHAGSRASRQMVEEAVDILGGAYLETWGLTEVVGSLTATTLGDVTGACAADDVLASVGRAVPSADVWSVRGDGTAADVGEDGELVTVVDTVFDGYWRDDAKTAEALRDGAFWTGDIGHVDAAGYVYLTGRRSELIISGGANVYPAEVERVLLDVPGVRQAAVVGVPDERWGEAVMAAVVLRPRAEVSSDDIGAHARANLARYKIPKRIAVLPALPETGSRKVDKRRLQELLTSSHKERTP